MFDYFEEAPRDIIGHLRPLFKQGACYIREDLKIGLKGTNTWNVSWIYTLFGEDRDCIIPLQVLFPHYGFIPSRCHRCWKVVVRPRTLKELFALYELQAWLKLPSKVGVEERPYIHSTYGGYFYSNTLEDGLACKTRVEKAIAADISPDIPIILKRGCTEFEQKYPNPATWTITKEQEEVEADIAEWLVLETKKVDQSELVIRNVKRRWVELAYACGDETYRDFTGGRPLYPAIKTYPQEKV